MPINGREFNGTCLRLNSFQHPSLQRQFSINSWRYKNGEVREEDSTGTVLTGRNGNPSLSSDPPSPPGPTGRTVLLPQLGKRPGVCWNAQCPVCSRVYLEMKLSTLSPSRNFMALQWILLQFSGCPRGPSSSWMYCSHRSSGKQNWLFISNSSSVQVSWCVTCGTRTSRS